MRSFAIDEAHLPLCALCPTLGTVGFQFSVFRAKKESHFFTFEAVTITLCRQTM